MQLFDFLRVKITPIEEERRNEIMDGGLLREGYDSLKVTVAATHVGYVNNNKFYYEEGSATTDSLPSWTKPYARPVIAMHDSKQKPLGRVHASQYITLPVLKDSKDGNSPKGVVMLDALITDAEGIKSIMNGELLTVSVKSVSDDITCSICDHKVKRGDMCEHERGETYEDQVCHWKVGKRTYKELSFVNEPADESDEHFAGVVSFDFGDGQLPMGLTTDSFKDTEDESVTAEDGVAIEIMDSAVPIKISAVKKDGETSLHKEIEGETIEDISTKDFTGWTDEDRAIIDWIDNNLDDEVARVQAELGLEDAPLSEKEKKSMDKKGGHFCGPHDPRKGRRSFPVGNCSHVVAALRLVSRYKGPGSKAKIRACVERRGRALKCGGASEDKDFLSLTEQLEQAKMQVTQLTIQLTDEKVFEHPKVKETLEDANKKIEKLTAQADMLKSQIESSVDENTALSVLEDENTRLYQLVHRFRAERLADLQLHTGQEEVKPVCSSEDPTTAREEYIRKLVEEKDSADLASAFDDLARRTRYGIVVKPKDPVEKITAPGIAPTDSREDTANGKSVRESRSDKTKRLFLGKEETLKKAGE